MPLTCRFYRHQFPEIDDIVMANVTSIEEMGAYVKLQEYNNKEGMILMSELSRRRIRSINKLLRVGRSECVVVLRVDKQKGYIDLSKRRATQEDIQKCEEKFARAKTVNSILRHVANLLEYETSNQLEELYDKTAWLFDDKLGQASACYDVFKHAVTNPEVLSECQIDDRTKTVLLEQIKRRLTPQPVKIRADVEVECYCYEGIDAVKTALKAGLALGNEDLPVKINLIAPPQYVVTVTTSDRSEGLALLNSALDKIKESILSSGGNFRVQMAPKIVSDTDEAQLAERLQKLDIMNREVSGDDDLDEADDEGMVDPGIIVNGDDDASETAGK